MAGLNHVLFRGDAFFSGRPGVCGSWRFGWSCLYHCIRCPWIFFVSCDDSSNRLDPHTVSVYHKMANDPCLFFIDRCFMCHVQTVPKFCHNPVLGRGEHIIEIHQRYIRNTTEQLVMHVIGQFVLCTYLTSQSLVIIPVCSVLFVIGRMTFWVGYIREPLKRIFGFMITFSVTSGCLLYSLFCFLMSGPTFALHD